MKRCSSWDHELLICQIPGCSLPAQWEGWYWVRDPMTGTPSGLTQKYKVCGVHKSLLGKPKENRNV